MAMADTAGLNIRVDSTSIPRAVTDLSQLAMQAGVTEAAVGRIGNTTSSFDRRVADLNREMQATDRAMKQAAGGIGTAAGETTKFGDSVGQSTQMLEEMVGELGRLDPRLGQAIASMQRFGIVAGAAFAAVAAGAATFGLAVQAAAALETDMLRLEAVIRATGGSAGLTAEQINEFANALDNETLASAPAIREAAARLMTFRSISGETFKEVLALSQDLAATGISSLSSAVVQLGRSLEDPATGLTLLKRVGLDFTDSQRQMIVAMHESGDVMGAQRAILDEISERVGGAGAGVAQGLAGQVDELALAWRRLLEELGERGPLEWATQAIDGLGIGIQILTDTWFPSLEQQLADAVVRLAEFREQSHFPAREILGVVGIGPTEAELQANVNELREQVATRERDAEAAQLQAEVARELAEAERVLGEEQEKRRKEEEKAEKERERIAERRVKSAADLAFEIENLELLRDANRQGADAYREMAIAVETRESLRALSLTAGTEEAQQLMDQYNLRNTLKEALDEEVNAREKLAAQSEKDATKRRDAVAALELEIEALGRLAAAREIGPAEERRVRAQLEVDRFMSRHDFAGAAPGEQARAARVAEQLEIMEMLEKRRETVEKLRLEVENLQRVEEARAEGPRAVRRAETEAELGTFLRGADLVGTAEADEAAWLFHERAAIGRIESLRELEASIDPVVRRQQDLLEMETNLTEAREMGLISADRQTELMQKYALSLEPISPLMRDLEQVGANTFRNLEDALIDVTSGTESFGDAFTDLVAGMLRDMQRLAIREMITRPLMEMFTVMLRGQTMMGGGGGGFAGGFGGGGGGAGLGLSVVGTVAAGALTGGLTGGLGGAGAGTSSGFIVDPFPFRAQHGLDYMVTGGGGPDSVSMPLMVTPGERVRVETPQQQRMAQGGHSTTLVGSMTISAPNAAPGIEQRIRREVVAALRQVRSEMVPSLVDALDRDGDLASSLGA